MTTVEFQTKLLELLRREPFVPFEVELVSGERFIVDSAEAVGCDAGAAGYIGPETIHFFKDEQTLRFNELSRAAS
jgi:hypothetical protein